MRELQRKQIIVAGVRLQYIEADPAIPSLLPPLVLLHQLLATAETLTELIAQLPADRRIVALDLLSAGPLDGGPIDTHAPALAELVTGFLRALQLVRPVLIGHSFGGTLALWIAASHALPLQGLVLLAPAHPFAGYRPHVVAFYLTRWGRFLALCIPLAPRRAILWAYNQAAGPTGPITQQHLAPHLRVLRHRNSLRRVLAILSTWEADMTLLRKKLLARAIELPALLLWGEHDDIVPPTSAAALLLSLPASELHTLPGCGHLLPEEAPEACAGLIRAWLEQHETRSACQNTFSLCPPQ